MSSFRIITLAMLLSLTGAANAYDVDFSLDGNFLIETYHPGSSKPRLQIWDIHLERMMGLSYYNEFNKLALVTMELFHLARDRQKYEIRFTDTYEHHPGNHKYSSDTFYSTSFNFKFGVGMQSGLNIKIVFYKDGSLKDISGSTFDEFDPAKITTYRLVKDKREVHIVQDNIFSTKSYYYHHRD